MTTGNITFVDSDYGSGQTGGHLFASRSWNGADRGYPLRRQRWIKEYHTDRFGVKHLTAKYLQSFPAHRDAEHNYVTVHKRYDHAPGTYRYWSTDHWVTSPTRSTWYAWTYTQYTWTSNDDIALVGKLRESIMGSDFDLGVTLGESHKTLKMIAQTATRLYRGYTQARKGNFLRAAKYVLQGVRETTRREKKILLDYEAAFASAALRAKKLSEYKFARTYASNLPLSARALREQARLEKLQKRLLKTSVAFRTRNSDAKSTVANGWLELQYGWKPLLRDIEGGAKAIAHATLPKQKRYRSTRKILYSPAQPNGMSLTLQAGDIVCQPKKSEVYYRKSLIAIVDEDQVPTYAGVIDASTVAWELLPFSFVADWVLPISGYLSARALVSRLNATYLTLTKVHTSGSNFKSEGANQHDFPNAYYREVYFSRVATGSLSLPYPKVKSFGKIASWGHAINALALLQTFRSR